MACGELVKRKHVLTGRNFLLPRLDLLLAPRRHRLHYAIDERADVLIRLCDAIHRDENRGRTRRRGYHSAIAIVLQGENALILVLLTLPDDCKFCNFRRGFSVNVGLYLSSVSILDFRRGERREGSTRTRFGLGRVLSS